MSCLYQLPIAFQFTPVDPEKKTKDTENPKMDEIDEKTQLKEKKKNEKIKGLFDYIKMSEDPNFDQRNMLNHAGMDEPTSALIDRNIDSPHDIDAINPRPKSLRKKINKRLN